MEQRSILSSVTVELEISPVRSLAIAAFLFNTIENILSGSRYAGAGRLDRVFVVGRSLICNFSIALSTLPSDLPRHQDRARHTLLGFQEELRNEILKRIDKEEQGTQFFLLGISIDA